jgi:pimeloyl-ACP methyl ester carboxylesterase
MTTYSENKPAMSDIALNLLERGRGEPAIVLVHGFTCNLSHWTEQLSGLSDARRCIAVDLPGHGGSAPPHEASIEVLAGAVNATLDTLQLDQAVLVGHSMGCRIVSEMFSQSPSRVRGIVHVDGSRVASGDAAQAVAATDETLTRTGMHAFIDQLYRGFFVDSTPAAVRDMINAGIASIDLDFARKLWLNLVRWDASRALAVLATVDVPLLLIQSTYLDAALARVSLAPGQSTPWLDQVRQTARDVSVAIVPGVGHFPMLEAPRQTNDAIASFVQGLDSR